MVMRTGNARATRRAARSYTSDPCIPCYGDTAAMRLPSCPTTSPTHARLLAVQLVCVSRRQCVSIAQWAWQEACRLPHLRCRERFPGVHSVAPSLHRHSLAHRELHDGCSRRRALLSRRALRLCTRLVPLERCPGPRVQHAAELPPPVRPPVTTTANKQRATPAEAPLPRERLMQASRLQALEVNTRLTQLPCQARRLATPHDGSSGEQCIVHARGSYRYSESPLLPQDVSRGEQRTVHARGS